MTWESIDWNLHNPTITRPMDDPRMVQNWIVWQLPSWHISRRQPSNSISRDNFAATKLLSHEGFVLVIWQPLNCDIKIDQKNDLVFIRSLSHYLREKTTWWPLGCPFATLTRKQPSGYQVVVLLPSQENELGVVVFLPSQENELGVVGLSFS
jgi:hypothetical protein